MISQPRVLAELNVLAKQPPWSLPRSIRHIHFVEPYQLQLRSLTTEEHQPPSGVDLDTQEIWLSRIVFYARANCEFGYARTHGQLWAFVNSKPDQVAETMQVPVSYLRGLATSGQLHLDSMGITFTLTRQPLRK